MFRAIFIGNILHKIATLVLPSYTCTIMLIEGKEYESVIMSFNKELHKVSM